jgi:hypothetical protein
MKSLFFFSFAFPIKCKKRVSFEHIHLVRKMLEKKNSTRKKLSYFYYVRYKVWKQISIFYAIFILGTCYIKHIKRPSFFFTYIGSVYLTPVFIVFENIIDFSAIFFFLFLIFTKESLHIVWSLIGIRNWYADIKTTNAIKYQVGSDSWLPHYNVNAF